MTAASYKIVRFHLDDEHPDHHKVVRRRLTLAQAQAHCSDESTHGGSYDDGTAWFDGYEVER